MGLGGVEGPPKKRLKQAQLNFSVTVDKTNNKRKLSDSTDGAAKKLFRKDPGVTNPPLSDKENVDSANDSLPGKVVKVMEHDPSLVVLDNQVDQVVQSKVLDTEKMEKTDTSETIDVAVIEIQDDDKVTSVDTGNAVPSSVTEATVSSPDAAKKELSDSTESSVQESEAPSNIDKEGKNGSVENENELPAPVAVSKSQSEPTDKNTITAGKEILSDSKDQDESALDKSFDSDIVENISGTISSDDEQGATATTPSRKRMSTPRSSSKKAERERLREEKRRLKKEKEMQKQKEKAEKDRKKQEDLRLKEEEKKKKEEERKRKEEAKEEERKRKDEERRKREDEKKKKEEMKEEDRRKKEEARLAEERKEKEKEQRAKAAFTKFFITEKSKPSLPKKDETEALAEKSDKPKFMPFPVKSDMRLAAPVRRLLTNEEKDVLNNVLTENKAETGTYLKELKNGRKPRNSPATWPLSDEQHDVIIVEFVDDESGDLQTETKSNPKIKGQRAKLLQFHENRRPPYWGTWRKPSKAVGPRNPFGQDKILDYEVDSDSEWEDEEEGEDIDKEDGDSDKEEADDDNVGENGYVLDNTFVPHGYLSDEEAAEAEEDESVEDQKLKLTVLKQEFDQELKSKTQRLQPKLLGCVYISNKTLEVSKSLYEPLMKLRCRWDPNEEPIDVLSPPVVECNPSPSVSNTKFSSSMVEQLAKLIHGNRSSMKALISEFLNHCDKDTQLSAVSKRAVFLKVKEIAAKTYSSGSGRLVWVVKPELCAEYGLEPIIDPPKAVPSVSPAVELPKPKDSPLSSFLKKSTPQRPIKRIHTILVSERDQPCTPSSGVGVVHVDTPRPKITQLANIVPCQPDKPIRRVATTLLSSVTGAAKNKNFNVNEIDKCAQYSMPKPAEATVVAAVDLTDSNDGIFPLSEEKLPPVLAACNLKRSPDRVNNRQLAVNDDVDGSTAAVPSDSTIPPVSGVTELSKPAVSVMQNPLVAAAHPLPEPSDNGRPKTNQTATDLCPASNNDAVSVVVATPVCAVSVPTPMEVDVLPESNPTSSNTPDDIVPKGSSLSVPVAALCSPATSNTAPSTPAPVRKRVPLVTLSKTTSKFKKTLSPGQKTSIADMFCRKPNEKKTPPNPKPVEPEAVVDLSSE